MNSTVKTVVFWVVMLATALLLWQVVRTGSPSRERELSFSEFMNQVEQNNISEITLYSSNEVTGQFKNENTKLKTVVRTQPSANK